MKKLNIEFSEYAFNITERKGKRYIFDFIRKRFVSLTPEEKVRQMMLNLLTKGWSVPRSLIAVEMNIVVNKLQKRCDVVVFNIDGNPVLIVECKAPEIKITQNVFDQIARYNLAMNAKYLLVTNGYTTYCCEMDYETNSYRFMEDIQELKLIYQK